MNKRFITVQEAISLLPASENVHTFYNEPLALIGADWTKDEIIDEIRRADIIELTGEESRKLNHGIAIYKKGTKRQDEILFIETDPERLERFDPQDEQKSVQKGNTNENRID